MKKSYYFVLIPIVLIIGTIMFFTYSKLNSKVKKNNTVDKPIVEENKISIDDVEKEDIHNNSLKNEKDNYNIVHNDEETTINKEKYVDKNIRDEKSTIKSVDKSTSNSNNTTESNNTPTTSTTPNTTDQVTTETKPSYIGVPDPNSIFYSIHKGKIEYKDLTECENKSFEVLYLDPIDIYGSWCIEVQDEVGTVLGAYLQVKCHSGNCDKYKN